MNPLVEQFRKGGVPKDLRLLAAQGALPLKPADLVELVHLLLSDGDATIRETSSATLAGFPVPELLPILKERQTPPQVLAWGLRNRKERELREVVLQNLTLPDEPIEELAPSLPSELAELVVINQVRLLRRTSLLEALESNPNLSNDQRRRLRELRESFHIGEAPEAPPPPPPAAEPEPTEAVPEEPVVFDEVLATEAEAIVRYLAEDERQESEKVGVVQRLYRLNTAEKVVTALKGTREERAILVRDPNRIVSVAVLGSPRLTDGEVENFSGMKNISDEILRQIGTNRDWTKTYAVCLNLVKNPRTPLAVSLGLVSRLNPKDIKSVSVDRNVPEVIRKQAQRFVKTVPGAGAQKR